jgi:hypothetical protein
VLYTDCEVHRIRLRPGCGDLPCVAAFCNVNARNPLEITLFGAAEASLNLRVEGRFLRGSPPLPNISSGSSGSNARTGVRGCAGAADGCVSSRSTGRELRPRYNLHRRLALAPGHRVNAGNPARVASSSPGASRRGRAMAHRHNRPAHQPAHLGRVGNRTHRRLATSSRNKIAPSKGASLGTIAGRPPTGDVEIGKQFRETADFRTLLGFANHLYPQRSWRQLFLVLTADGSRTPEGRLGRYPADSELQQWYQIDGEPFSDAAAQKLQDYVRRVLDGLIAGRLQFSTGLLPFRFSYHPTAGLHASIDYSDLKLAYDWLVWELIRQGRHRLLSRCAECGNYWLRRRQTAKYCTDPCRKRAHNRSRR